MGNLAFREQLYAYGELEKSAASGKKHVFTGGLLQKNVS